MARRQVGQIEGSAGSGGNTTLLSEAFAGDDTETVFSLADTGGVPFIVDVGGQVMRPGTDYTVSGSVVTMAVAPSTGQDVVVHYSTGVNVTTDPLGRALLDTSGAIVMNMENLKQKMFLGSAAIAGIKTWTITNAVNALKFTVFFTLTGTPVQTLPANFKGNDGGLVGGVWTPAAAGDYVMTGEFNGTNWHIRIDGPNA
jgi:hypothetical protein